MPSSVATAPSVLAAAAADVGALGSSIREAAAAANASTTSIAVAAGDDVSAAVARFFGEVGTRFQTAATEASEFAEQFGRRVAAAASAYADADAVNSSPLAGLQRLFEQPGTGPTGIGAAAATNGVTGVREGFSFLQIQVGPFTYTAPARWYFPTQANGSVTPNGVIYLQHGFGAIAWFYRPLAMDLAEQTNSIVVTPTIPTLPLPFGFWINSPQMQHGVASLFLGNEAALNLSAHQAGFRGTLPSDFILAGHSAGGGLATIAAGNYLAALGGNLAENHLRGVVMFDGVTSNSGAFASAISQLRAAHIPDYVVAAPPQLWNSCGATTNELINLNPDQFVGVELACGSHVDSMLGDQPIIDFLYQLAAGFSPPGNTAAVHTLATGWINDMYAGGSPTNPIYGVYGPNRVFDPSGTITLGPATGFVLG